MENITVDDLGQYNCILEPASAFSNPNYWYLARLGLNIQGPYFENLWDKYEINTIIGISAGFGFLAMAVATVLVYHYRYQLDQEDTCSAHGSSSKDSVELDKSQGSPNNILNAKMETKPQIYNEAFDETGETSSSQTSSDDGTTF